MSSQQRISIDQQAISERQREIHRLAKILSAAATRQGSLARMSKVALILLGAFVATTAVADQIFGEGNTGVLISLQRGRIGNHSGSWA